MQRLHVIAERAVNNQVTIFCTTRQGPGLPKGAVWLPDCKTLAPPVVRRMY